MIKSSKNVLTGRAQCRIISINGKYLAPITLMITHTVAAYYYLNYPDNVKEFFALRLLFLHDTKEKSYPFLD
jgi:hypothetical protein